jgi:hypothetical protein
MILIWIFIWYDGNNITKFNDTQIDFDDMYDIENEAMITDDLGDMT